MHPFGSYLATQHHNSLHEDDWRAADRWRRLHQRPDAPLLPAQEGPGRLEHALAAVRTVRRALRPRLTGDARRLEGHGGSRHAR